MHLVRISFALFFILSAAIGGASAEVSADDNYSAVISAKLVRAMKAPGTPEEGASLVKGAFPDERDRASFLLSLLGSDSGPWSAHSALDELAVEQLNEVSHIALAAALARAGKTPDGIRGAARWIIAERAGSPPEPGVLGAILRKIVRVGLSHPQKGNRELTVAFLAKLGTSESVLLLKECLEGKYLPVATVPGAEPARPKSETADQTPSERAQAALALASRQDMSIIPLLENLLRNATREDESLYRKALGLLRKTADAGAPPKTL